MHSRHCVAAMAASPSSSSSSPTYVMKVEESCCTRATAWGAMQGIRTLRQLLEIRDDSTAWLYRCTITDEPQHLHRGILAPRGATLVELQQWIDHTTALKFNVLHWPLVAAADSELPHVLEFVRIITAYAARRGMQTLLQLHPRVLPSQALRQAFVERMLAHAHNTSPMVDADAADISAKLPHAPLRVADDWRTVNDAQAVVVLDSPVGEEEHDLWVVWAAKLASGRGARMRGASLRLPAPNLALVQAAALLWQPAKMATSPDDVRLGLAVRATYPNVDIPSSKPSVLEIEAAL